MQPLDKAGEKLYFLPVQNFTKTYSPHQVSLVAAGNAVVRGRWVANTPVALCFCRCRTDGASTYSVSTWHVHGVYWWLCCDQAFHVNCLLVMLLSIEVGALC